MITILSTDNAITANQKQRVSNWNSKISEFLDGLRIDSCADDFHGHVTLVPMGKMALLNARTSAASVKWLGCNFSKPKEHSLVLHVQNLPYRVSQPGGRNVNLADGGIAICDTNKPYTLELASHNDMLVLEVPMHIMEGKVPELSDLIFKEFSVDNSKTRVFKSFLRNIVSECAAVENGGELATEFEDVLLDLLTLTLTNIPATHPAKDTATGLQQKLIKVIHQEFKDPQLNTTRLADIAGVSARTVQTTFARMGTTPTNYILERRLVQAARLLQEFPQKLITQIAYDAGFNDSCYFTRRFRERFHASPKCYRMPR
jgi:AraC-like DNA-binding protein